MKALTRFWFEEADMMEELAVYKLGLPFKCPRCGRTHRNADSKASKKCIGGGFTIGPLRFPTEEELRRDNYLYGLYGMWELRAAWYHPKSYLQRYAENGTEFHTLIKEIGAKAKTYVGKTFYCLGSGRGNYELLHHYFPERIGLKTVVIYHNGRNEIAVDGVNRWHEYLRVLSEKQVRKQMRAIMENVKARS